MVGKYNLCKRCCTTGGTNPPPPLECCTGTSLSVEISGLPVEEGYLSVGATDDPLEENYCCAIDVADLNGTWTLNPDLNGGFWYGCAWSAEFTLSRFGCDPGPDGTVTLHIVAYDRSLLEPPPGYSNPLRNWEILFFLDYGGFPCSPFQTYVILLSLIYTDTTPAPGGMTCGDFESWKTLEDGTFGSNYGWLSGGTYRFKRNP